MRAAIALSPGARDDKPETLAGFANIRIPFFAITGTRDEVRMLNDVTPRLRALVYEPMPPGGKHLAVFAGGDHMVFGGHRLARAPHATDRHIQGAVAAMTTAFWRAYLLDDTAARSWLREDAARMTGPGDVLRSK